MKHEKSLVVDLTKREDSTQVLPHSPKLSSQQAVWNGVFLAHYHYPAHKVPAHHWTQHIIGITGAKSPINSEHRLDGQFKRCLYSNGEVTVIPANVSYSSVWYEEGEFTLLSLCPKFLEKVAHESVNGDRVEIIPQFALVDPLIQ